MDILEKIEEYLNEASLEKMKRDVKRKEETIDSIDRAYKRAKKDAIKPGEDVQLIDTKTGKVVVTGMVTSYYDGGGWIIPKGKMKAKNFTFSDSPWSKLKIQRLKK